MDGGISISRAKAYYKELARLAQEIEYARHEFGKRLERYQENTSPETRVDLQSSIAQYEKYIMPFAVARRYEEELTIEGAETLTLGIDGHWGAYEFRQLFEGVDYLSKVYMIRIKLDRDSPDFRLSRGMTRSPVYRKARLHYYLSTREELRVREIRFASPGLVTFEGAGEVLKELRETFDYVVTGEFAKRFIDNFWQIKDKTVRSEEFRARLAQARARTAEADACREEAILRQIEARSKIKAAIHQIREQDMKRDIGHSERTELGIKKINELADTVIMLEAKELACLPVVEDSIVRSLSVLHRLSYEAQKVKPGLPRETIE